MLMCVAVAVGAFFALQKPYEAVQKAKIGDGVFSLRVAQTEKARERGLGGTPALAQNEGMLFIFPQDDFHAIWMKDMLVPIDIVWLSAEREVIDARENISPDTFPSVFTTKYRARFVVELPAGSLKTFRIKIGSRAEFFAK